MGKTLKVLNAVRQFEVGIPITLFQCARSFRNHPLSG